MWVVYATFKARVCSFSVRLEPCSGMDDNSVLPCGLSAEKESDYEQILHLVDVH